MSVVHSLLDEPVPAAADEQPAGGVLLGVVVAPPAVHRAGQPARSRPARWPASAAGRCAPGRRARAAAAPAGRPRRPPPARPTPRRPAVRTTPVSIAMHRAVLEQLGARPSTARPAPAPAGPGSSPRRRAGTARGRARRRSARRRCRARRIAWYCSLAVGQFRRPGRPASAVVDRLAGQPGEPQRADPAHHVRARAVGQRRRSRPASGGTAPARRPGPSRPRRLVHADGRAAQQEAAVASGRPGGHPAGVQADHDSPRRSTSPTAASPLPPRPTTQASARRSPVSAGRPGQPATAGSASQPTSVAGRAASVSGHSTLDRNALVRSCCGLASTSRGSPDFDDHAGVHEHQRVGDLAGEAHLVGHHDHGHAAAGQLPSSRPAPRRPAPGPAPRSARRRASAWGPSPAPGRSPPAAAGRRTAAPGRPWPSRPGPPGPAAARPARRRLGLLQLLDPDRRLDDVLQRGQVREQVEPLEHHADVAALPGGVLGCISCSLPPRSW